MKTITLKNIGKSFGLPDHCSQRHFWALKDIDLEISQPGIFGIIGRNGSGKTTLLKIVSGLIQPTEGEIKIQGKVCTLFTLGSGFQDKLSGKENIFLNGSLLGMSDAQIKSKYSSIVEFSQLGDFIDLPLGSYSQGMRMRLGFSIATHIDFDILVIDEVLMVGDSAFQKKCFQRLTDFKRAGKTMLITTQSLDLVERLCDKVFLLEEGRLIKQGTPQETSDHYLQLLSTERRSLRDLGPPPLVKKTKWWTEERHLWGTQEGTKEIVIESVELMDRWGRPRRCFKSGQRMICHVSFLARETIGQPVFGLALFRQDGVYCYGPNTAFDGYAIKRIPKGRGWFKLEYHNLSLMPGIYYLSVGIWDKGEILAYDHHRCYYKIEVKGINSSAQLLHLPHRWGNNSLFDRRHIGADIELSRLKEQWQKESTTDGARIDSVSLMDAQGGIKEVFFTGEQMRIAFSWKNTTQDRQLYLWSGLFRQDSVFCHSALTRLDFYRNKAELSYPRLFLLPGGYRLSVGIWDAKRNVFLTCHHGTYPFQVVFDRRDHGTVYLEHKWKWRLPQGKIR